MFIKHTDSIFKLGMLYIINLHKDFQVIVEKHGS